MNEEFLEYWREGNDLLKQKKYDDALEMLNIALSSIPESNDYNFHKFIILMDIGSIKALKELYGEAKTAMEAAFNYIYYCSDKETKASFFLRIATIYYKLSRNEENRLEKYFYEYQCEECVKNSISLYAMVSNKKLLENAKSLERLIKKNQEFSITNNPWSTFELKE
ncbi:hypothetical protein HYV79_05305 [Candidatus Woesearchaeota archaeon]|nr:hypothetical protein [Candidatus Woesearchaeota archaeon]